MPSSLRIPFLARARAPILVGLLVGLTLFSLWAQGEESKPIVTASARWQSSLDAFAAADRVSAPAQGGVVFVGSSSIRLWTDLENSFEKLPTVVKRGFGGSRLQDCVDLVEQLVLSYKPKLVVVYAGENDLAEGATPVQVLERFESFVQKIKASLPESRIAFVSIKPSPLRASLIPAVRDTNALIQTYSQNDPQLVFIDVFASMLDENGRPREELFADDRLHLNADGYSLWQKLISARL